MLGLVFLIAAIVCFILAAFSVAAPVHLGWLGLAFFAAAHIAWNSIALPTRQG